LPRCGIGEAVTSSISANSYTDTYSYDLVGNRLSKTDVVGTTTTVTSDIFNNNDQLTSETGTVNGSSSWSTSYGYDANGSQTTVTRTGTGAETDTYGYDLQHRLNYANITRTEQGQSVGIVVNSYLYDDAGYRDSGSVTVTVAGTPTTTNTNYLTDTNNPTGYTQVLEEHTTGTAPSMSYIIGLGVVAQTNASGATSYLMPDAQGSTRQLTDASANITARFAFDAWGNLLYVPIGVLNPAATEILYTGQLFDVAVLIYQLRARPLKASSGRFLTMDSFGGVVELPVTLHKYLYADGNPVNKADPSGFTDTIQISVVEEVQEEVETGYTQAVQTARTSILKRIVCQIALGLVIEGVYVIIVEGLGDPPGVYVGQSGNIADRVAYWTTYWEARGATATLVKYMEVLPSLANGAARKFVRELVEQSFLTAIRDAVAKGELNYAILNKINPVSEANLAKRIATHLRGATKQTFDKLSKVFRAC
jgi:RHS repeat-associated protein